VLLAVHGYPPELVGGTESTVQELARGLSGLGHEVGVCAGSIDWRGGPRLSASEDRGSDGPAFPVWRLHRADLYFDHWHKSASAWVEREFAGLLARFRPDVVHVHHWLRLSRGRVATAARAGIPAVVTLHDFWSSCLVTFRIRPDTRRACSAPLARDPCVGCAAQVPPATPWVGADDAALRLAEHKAEIMREIELARAVLAPSRSHGAACARHLGLEPARLAIECLPPARRLSLPRVEPPEVHGAAPGAPLVLASWGKLSELKGADLVVEALRLLPDPARALLHVAGTETEPGYAARLRERARGLDVVFHGDYVLTDLHRHPVARAHAAVLGTRASESYGYVLDEALMLGLPCVLPRAGALLERAAGGGWALFYEPDDAASLSRAIARLASEPGLVARLRAALPDRARSVPDYGAMLARHVEIYADAIRRGAPTRADTPAAEAARLGHLAAAESAWDAALSSQP
jgi:glycosyltransferase involved in cell wall biosynthesis